MNKVVLTGRVSREPKLYNAGQNGERLNLTIAWNERQKGADVATFTDVALFGPAASNAHRFLEIGDEIHVAGRLSQLEIGKDATGSYDRAVLGIIADQFDGITFGRKKGQGFAPINGDAAPAQAPAGAEEKVPF